MIERVEESVVANPDLRGMVTVHHRDWMEQERLPIRGLLAWLLERARYIFAL